MEAFATQFAIATLALSLSFLIAWPLLRLLRRRPIEAYRLACLVLFASLVLPPMQSSIPFFEVPGARLLVDTSKTWFETSESSQQVERLTSLRKMFGCFKDGWIRARKLNGKWWNPTSVSLSLLQKNIQTGAFPSLI